MHDTTSSGEITSSGETGGFAPGGTLAGASSPLGSWSEGRVVLRVRNTNTEVVVFDEFILKILSYEARYPTQTVEMLKYAPQSSDSMGWDGWVRLLKRPKTALPFFPTGLLPRLARVARKFGYHVEIQDERVRPEGGVPEPMRNPIIDRQYQLEAAAAAEKYGRGILDMPPRSGKTRTMCEIVRRIALPTVWIAPTDRIVTQTQQVLEGFFGPNFAMHLVGTKELERAKFCNIVCCTAATANNLPGEFYATRQMIVVDEWHHSASKTYQQILQQCDHVFYRFGMTGTHFRSGQDDLAMHGLISKVIYKVSSKFLLDEGHLVPTRVFFLPVDAPKLRGVPAQWNTGHGKFGVHEHEWRNQLVAQAALTLHNLGRKVLCLVGTKRQGYMIKQLIEAFLPRAPGAARFETVEFVSTDKARPHQAEILESYLENREVKILIGTSLLGEGVDLPEVDALVYATGQKAEVSLTQNAYRVCTKLPGKDDAIIVDFADRHHRKLKGHAHARLETYYGEPTFTVSVLQDPNTLANFV